VVRAGTGARVRSGRGVHDDAARPATREDIPQPCSRIPARHAFEQISTVAADNFAVLIRQLEALDRIAGSVRTPGRRRALLAQVDTLLACARRHTELPFLRQRIEATAQTTRQHLRVPLPQAA